MKNMFKSP